MMVQDDNNDIPFLDRKSCMKETIIAGSWRIARVQAGEYHEKEHSNQRTRRRENRKAAEYSEVHSTQPGGHVQCVHMSCARKCRKKVRSHLSQGQKCSLNLIRNGK